MLRRPSRIASIVALAGLLFPVTTQAGGPSRQTPTKGTIRWQTLLASPAVQTPTALAIDLRGDPSANKWAYTADAAMQRIVKFGTGGVTLGSWQYGDPKNRGTAAGLAVDTSGNVLVADPATNDVSKFSSSGKLLARWTGFQSPRAVTVDRAGNIYVAEYAAHRVTKLSPAGAVLTRFDTAAIWPPGGPSNPTGVAPDPPDSLYVSTTCAVGATCGVGLDSNPHPDMIDGLLEFISQGSRQGSMKEIWFGAGHSFAGGVQGGQSKEQEPFVTISGIAGDRQSNLYVAGLLWPLGGRLGMGVLAYTQFGYRWGRWYLPGAARPAGIAVDGRGALYVSQGHRILKLTR